MKTVLLTALLVALGATASADGAKKPKSKVKAADFSIGDLPALPTGDGMKATEEHQKVETKKPADPSVAKYTLAGVTHAEQFIQHENGYEARHAISRIDVVNLPMTVASFHTLVRVHSDDKLGAAIEVRLLDPRGNQVLSSQGALVFAGHPEADFLIDWDPFTLQKSGTYEVVVAVAGQEIGRQPFPVVQELSAHLTATPVEVDAGPPPPEAPKETWP